jgi:hypothetical protein
MDPLIEFSALVDRATYRAAQRLHMRGHTAAIWAGQVALVAYAGWKLLPLSPGRFLAVLPICLLFAPLLVWFQRRNLDRIYQSSPYLGAPVRMVMSREGIRFEAPTGEGMVPWSKFVKVRRARGLMLLYQTPRLFTIVARKFFASDEDWANAAALASRQIAAQRGA